jgi:hypothetical protein
MKARYLLSFNTLDKKVHISVYFQEGTFWLTQKAMAELFGVNVPAVNKHLKNIFETGELHPDSVISKMETTAADGKNYITNFYRLEAILAVGYRVNSLQATEFRKWATGNPGYFTQPIPHFCINPNPIGLLKQICFKTNFIQLMQPQKMNEKSL